MGNVSSYNTSGFGEIEFPNPAVFQPAKFPLWKLSHESGIANRLQATHLVLRAFAELDVAGCCCRFEAEVSTCGVAFTTATAGGEAPSTGTQYSWSTCVSVQASLPFTEITVKDKLSASVTMAS
mmetsp:Transcript_63247/g.205229  ORF Transcript_63247/g.205229 Transcript_63247/m.205229 type:complete len:124 (-) Transcript_63247:1406-1777(-)